MEEDEGKTNAQKIDSGSNSEEETERVHNPLSKNKYFHIANATDSYIFVGVDEERRTDLGGRSFVFNVAGFGIGYKSSNKEHKLFSRIPWEKVGFHW